MRKLRSLRFLLPVFTFLGVQAADQVVGGPFVVNVSARSAQIVWVVKSGEASLKALGANPRLAPLLRSESVTFNALRAGTVYDYGIPARSI